jgi:hypothetical protein
MPPHLFKLLGLSNLSPSRPIFAVFRSTQRRSQMPNFRFAMGRHSAGGCRFFCLKERLGKPLEHLQ